MAKPDGKGIVSGALKVGGKTLRVGAGLVLIAADGVGRLLGGAFSAGKGLVRQASKSVGTGVHDVAQATGRAAEATGSFMVELGEPFQSQAGVTKVTTDARGGAAEDAPEVPKRAKKVPSTDAKAENAARPKPRRRKASNEKADEAADPADKASDQQTKPQGKPRARKPRAKAASPSPDKPTPTVH